MPAFSSKAPVYSSGGPPLLFTGATTVLSSATLSGIWDITDDGTTFVAAGQVNNSNIYTSTDGTTWTIRNIGIAQTVAHMACNGTTFVSVPSAGLLCHESTDPTVTWTSRTILVGGAMLSAGIFWDETTGLFIIVGTDLSVARVTTSPDGITWTERTMPATMDIANAIYRSSDNTLVILGQTSATDAVYSTSTNGTTWGTPTTFDSGTNAQQLRANFDTIYNRHYLCTVEEFGYITNNSGPPSASAWTEIGTNEANTLGVDLGQANEGGPLIWADGTNVKWTTDFSTVTTLDLSSNINSSIFNVRYGFDGNYYACGSSTGPSRGIIARLTI